MDAIFRALGFESKPEYTEKIPENLDSSDFKVQETFHHGFPSQPTCLEYDAVQQLLAIGTETGAILLLGKPGLERYFKHKTRKAIVKMQFITNKGLLVTCCEDGLLHLWSIKEQNPEIIHTLEFTRENEKPTCLSCSYMSEWLYVGSEGGNVYVVHIPSFIISGFTVYWDKCIGNSARSKPGRVISILEDPMDQGKILIAFIGGHCVLYNLKHHENHGNALDSKQPPDHKRFSFNPGDNHIMTSVSWVTGKSFACSYSDGSIVLWKSETKPEKVFFLHDFPPSQFRPIYKMQVVNTDGEPLYVCSGGFPEKSDDAPLTLTLMQGKSSTMVSSSSTIIDFLCLPSSPHSSDCQRLSALVILAKNEMIIHDLNTPGYPRYPSYSLPYALDIHLPSVTFVYYSASCPEEFIAQLHSVKSKMMAPSTKPWPCNGGKWGQEVPHSTTDIIVTGHTDGSVRLWHCNSVIFQPFFTVDTSRYFKTLYSGARAAGDPSPTKNKTPPMRPPPPSHPPPQSRMASDKNFKKVKTPTTSTSTTPGAITPGAITPGMITPGAITPGAGVSTTRGDGTETPDTEVGEEVMVGQDSKVVPSPATGQVHSMEIPPPSPQQEDTDGGDGTAPPVERRSISYKDKTSKKKRSRLSLDVPASLPEEHDNGEELATPQTPGTAGEKKHSILSGKSFRKMAKMVKMGSKSTDKKHVKQDEGEGEGEEVDREGGGGEMEGITEESTSPTHKPSSSSTEPGQKPRKRPPPRPKDIALRQNSHSSEGSNAPKVTFTTSATEEGAHNLEGNSQQKQKQQEFTKKSPHKHDSPSSRTQDHDLPLHKLRESPHRLTTRAQACRIRSEAEDEFFFINYIQMCMCGFWLCVANDGGSVMTFDFTTKPRSQPAGNVDINFDYDSVKKQYTPSPCSPDNDGGLTIKSISPSSSSSLSSPSSSSSSSSSSSLWSYDEKVTDSSTGYCLTQMCRCFFTISSNGGASPSSSSSDVTSSSEKKPVAINHIQYSKDIRLLAIATRRGFAIVDVQKNVCLYVLSSSTSILYLADPSKFTTQMRRESKQNLVAHPSIKRHGTSVRFSDSSIRHKGGSTAASMYGGPKHMSQPALKNLDESRESVASCGKGCEVSVELESCVSSIELVQIQLDKLSGPMLTLWVGLASGYIVAYNVKVLNGSGKRLELIPTRLIMETKSPVVKIMFLNEWGDCQVVPYKLNRDMSPHGESEEELGHASQRRKSTQPDSSNSSAPRHYGIFVDENKIRSFSFPGYNKIDAITLPISSDKVILRSDYFTSSDLPCLASITSCHILFVHSLPGLKQMMRVPFPTLSDPRVMGTFRVSGTGQCLYMSSTSEIQRISIVKENMLNYPDCLPSVYAARSDVPTSSYGKGFLGGLFSGTPTTVNREEMFGEAAAVHPIGNICKVDGENCLAYGSKRRKRKPPTPQGSAGRDDSVGNHSGGAGGSTTGMSRRETRRTQGGGGGGGGGGGLSGQLNKNRTALDERSRKLGETEKKSEQMADSASNYNDLARQLAQKYAK